ncbi:1-aminocyclopropane-1-carboxylate deaminase/D-cysteine desulfhydrase [Hymenobacter guriensis]|nr:pyridoxal-phosphate dependent enzyme [Hymenobacter guriensis]
MMMPPAAPLLLQPLDEPAAAARGIRLLLLRDDLTHSELPGNKWRKLKYNLQAAREQGHDKLLTFGGAYSNHIAAVAAAGRLSGLRTIGIIRGEELAHRPLNATLTRARADGMQLRFVSREAYQRRHESGWVAELQQDFGPAYVLPEGGSNALALPGCAELLTELRTRTSFDYVAVACGTGGTLAGLVTGLLPPETAVGIAALREGELLRAEVQRLLGNESASSNWVLHSGFHHGGYARFSAGLLDFIRQFQARHGVLLDPVYTGKLLWGVLQLLEQDYFRPGSTLVAVHTGGLQGWAGFRQRFGKRSAWWPTEAAR